MAKNRKSQSNYRTTRQSNDRTPRPPQPPRKCVFCGNMGVTKEHVFSNWMRQVLPDTPIYDDSYRKHGINGLGQTSLATSFKRKGGSCNSQTVSVVCEGCNSGWMSSVVDKAKPTAREMILGNAVMLDRSQMTAIATWVTLAAMMEEFTTNADRAVPEYDLMIMKNNQLPPPAWTVFIGLYIGTAWQPIHTFRHRVMPEWIDGGVIVNNHPSAVRRRTLITTYNLKHLLIQVFCTHDVEMENLYLEFPRPSGTLKIWPPTDLSCAIWPPMMSVGDPEAKQFADGFYHSQLLPHGHTNLEHPPLGLPKRPR